jgi:hypothetical protein
MLCASLPEAHSTTPSACRSSQPLSHSLLYLILPFESPRATLVDRCSLGFLTSAVPPTHLRHTPSTRKLAATPLNPPRSLCRPSEAALLKRTAIDFRLRHVHGGNSFDTLSDLVSPSLYHPCVIRPSSNQYQNRQHNGKQGIPITKRHKSPSSL